ncbi:MAG: 30S ribosomal protein S7 [Rickettsiales bacterium]|nr:MAG: 30S ribosomal protein S7 [Rickettsiales bacterium]
MSRRHAAVKRVVKPDTKYKSVLLSKFINNLMKDGKKSIAEKIVYDAMERVEKKHGANPLETFNESINNVKPYVEVSSVRVGGANYQVPSPVDERRGYALAIRWLVDAAQKRSGRSMVEKLAEELFDAANSRGVAIKKREDTHKMAEANKAFAHFAQRQQR